MAVLGSVLIGSLGTLPASATGWVTVPGIETVTENPCTGQETTLELHDVQRMTSGRADDHEGIRFKGRFTTGDGFTGTFHDLDQWNAVPSAGDVVYTSVVLFRGADDGKRRVTFATVFHVVVRDDMPTIMFHLGDGRCVGRPQHPG